MSEQVRHLIGLENLLAKARRRQRECERDEGSAQGPRTRRYAQLVSRLGEEIHQVDRGQLEEYLRYVEQDLVPRILQRVETAKEKMVDAAKHVVAGIRERLGQDPIMPLEARFGLGAHPPHADRATREAHDLVKEYLKL